MPVQPALPAVGHAVGQFDLHDARAFPMPAPPRGRMEAHSLASTRRADDRASRRRSPASAPRRRCRSGRPASRIGRGSSGRDRRSRSRRTNRSLTMASKNPAANGSDRASAWIGNTPPSTPASRMRSQVLRGDRTTDRWPRPATPNSRRRKIDEPPLPQPEVEHAHAGPQVQRGRQPFGHPERVRAAAHAGVIQSGWYFDERGKRSETNGDLKS